MKTIYWIFLILLCSIVSAQIAIVETKNRLFNLTEDCQYAEEACNQAHEACLAVEVKTQNCELMVEALNEVVKECK